MAVRTAVFFEKKCIRCIDGISVIPSADIVLIQQNIPSDMCKIEIAVCNEFVDPVPPAEAVPDAEFLYHAH